MQADKFVVCEQRKRGRIVFKILIGIVILSMAGIGTVNAISMEGGKHDLSAAGGSVSLCDYCHVKHDSAGGQTAQWNRTETTTVFTPYTSRTMDATMSQPGSVSLLCLSCHDGVTAFDALNGSAGTPGNNMNTISPGSTAIIGPDLSDDHPIGVDIRMDSEGIKHESVIRGAGLEVYDSKVECASCHDVHGGGGYTYFLRLDPASGSLCVTCHNK